MTALALALAASLATGQAGAAAETVTVAQRAAWRVRFERPAHLPEPAGNPQTPAKAALGRALFFDPRLSGSGGQSCAACHRPDQLWGDDRRVPLADAGRFMARRAQSLLDVAWAAVLLWDGRADDLDRQALGPIAAPNIMNLPIADAVARLRQDPALVRRFADAFPDLGPDAAISGTTIGQALGSFERTLVTSPAPVDHWLAGDDQALLPEAIAGFALFVGKARCATCHDGWRFTDDAFHDIGLPATADLGRGQIDPDLPVTRYAFRTPGLRNVTRRPPYMHDGSLPTIDAVLDHYASVAVARPSLSPDLARVELDARERSEMKAFLGSLASDGPR